MKMRGRVAAIVIAGAVAVGGVGVPLLWLAPADRAPQARAGPDLPWPYCAPDAERPAPSPTPWPALEADPNSLEDPAPPPVAKLIVIPDSIQPADAGTYPLVEGVAAAIVGVRELFWDAGGARAAVTPGEELWVGAPAELLSATGGEILLGLGERRSDGLWSTRFAVALSGPSGAFIGPSPFAERQTRILEAFRTWKANPVSGATARDLILAWNREATEGDGPIQAAWERFVDEVVLQRTAYPAAGTPAWWHAAPPMCRSVLDAPEDIRRRLTFGTVWVRVPADWAVVRDAVLCLQTSIGSGGCSTLPRADGFPYVRFEEAYAVPGEPLEVRVAHLLEGQAVSWVERRTVARIPYDAFTRTGVVLVDLSRAGISMTRYEDLAVSTDPDLVPVEALGLAEEEGLLLQAPTPPPSDPDRPQGETA